MWGAGAWLAGTAWHASIEDTMANDIGAARIRRLLSVDATETILNGRVAMY